MPGRHGDRRGYPGAMVRAFKKKYSLLSFAFLNLYVAFPLFQTFWSRKQVENVKQESIDERRERLNPHKYFRGSYLREAVTKGNLIPHCVLCGCAHSFDFHHAFARIM
jgi:hypothetical protein